MARELPVAAAPGLSAGRSSPVRAGAPSAAPGAGSRARPETTDAARPARRHPTALTDCRRASTAAGCAAHAAIEWSVGGCTRRGAIQEHHVRAFQVGDDQAQEGRHRLAPCQVVRQAHQEHRGRRQDGRRRPRRATRRCVDAVQKAKKTSVPNDNIDRAIKRGAGLTGESVEYTTIMYEGYGPNGVALLIECLTDNKNRAAAEVRTLMTRNGGTMADPGSVAYNFARKGVIVVPAEGTTEDDVLLAVLDAGAEEVDRRGRDLRGHHRGIRPGRRAHGAAGGRHRLRLGGCRVRAEPQGRGRRRHRAQGVPAHRRARRQRRRAERLQQLRPLGRGAGRARDDDEGERRGARRPPPSVGVARPRVLGIDPGLTRCGVGVVDVEPNRSARSSTSVVLRSPADLDIAEPPRAHRRRASRRSSTSTGRRPSRSSASSRSSNVRTVMGTAQVSAASRCSSPRERGLPVALHTPTEVKAAITGYGAADKAPGAERWSPASCGSTRVPKPADAADALALALCHAWRTAESRGAAVLDAAAPRAEGSDARRPRSVHGSPRSVPRAVSGAARRLKE